MPVHNGKYFLQESIESILKQSFSHFEFIIIDDASNDGSFDLIKKFKDKRIQVLRNKNLKGVATSLNRGLSMAKGIYIARMDADDRAKSTRLEEQINFLENNRDIYLVGSWAEKITVTGKKIGTIKVPITDREIHKEIFRQNTFIHPSVLFRKKILKTTGMYKEEFEGAEDYDFFLRIVANFKTANIPKFLHFQRISRTSVSSTKLKKMEKQALRARLHALKVAKAPLSQYMYLIKPAVSFLIPSFIKQILLYGKNN